MKKLIKTIFVLMAIICVLGLVACDHSTDTPKVADEGESEEEEKTPTYEVTYTFTDSVKKVGSQKITINSTETEYDIVEFGDFPQTIKADEVAVDETQSITRGAHTYYVGSDGNYYAKVNSNYYKVEPIKWRVLTKNYNSTNKALLLAENILTANVPFYEDYQNNRTIDSKTVYPNNYMHSQVRAYLNGLDYQGKDAKVSTHKNKGFLQTAFTEAAQSKIVTTTVDNSEDSTTDTGNNISKATPCACDNTNDKIFLLSLKEVTTADYGFDAYNSNGQGNSRIRMTTDYAKANNAYQSGDTGYGGYWWLRSPYYITIRDACYVYIAGYAFSNLNVISPSYGVVPALSIELGSID